MKKTIVLMILSAIVCVGCQNEVVLSQDESGMDKPIETAVIEVNEVMTSEPTQETEDNSIGGREHHVEAIGNIESFEKMANLSGEQKTQLDSFGIEKCYFKPVHEPKDMVIDHMTISEIGFFLTYVNKKTEENFNLIWWANTTPTEYLDELKEILDKNTNSIERKIISRNGIDYYCNFRTPFREPSDKTEREIIYHAEIRWIEDDKCMYVQIDSLIPFDDSIVDH